MNQSSIACFLSAARTGNFSDTARELYMTRQAVSKNIQDMEQEFGFPLFHKGYFPLTLTTAGAKLYDYYSTLDFDLSAARRIFKRVHDTMPNLRLSWGTWTRPDNQMLDRINSFADEKKVRISAVQGQETEVLEQLRTGEADVAFLSRYMTTFILEPCTVIKISELPMQFAIARDHPLKDVGDLGQIIASMPYLACWGGESKESEVIGRVSRELLSYPKPPREIRIYKNVETVFLNVMLGNGVSCSPAAHLYGYGIETFQLDRTVSMCMVWFNRNKNPSIEELAQWMTERGT